MSLAILLKKITGKQNGPVFRGRLRTLVFCPRFPSPRKTTDAKSVAEEPEDATDAKVLKAPVKGRLGDLPWMGVFQFQVFGSAGQ
jgi:hypothetical protein